jgi:hypothetical protein
MALVQCAECGGEISDKATACPHCGAPRVSVAAGAEPAVHEPPPGYAPAPPQTGGAAGYAAYQPVQPPWPAIAHAARPFPKVNSTWKLLIAGGLFMLWGLGVLLVSYWDDVKSLVAPQRSPAAERCRRGSACAEVGFCTPEPGNETNCMAATDEDCRQSALCRTDRMCRANPTTGMCTR